MDFQSIAQNLVKTAIYDYAKKAIIQAIISKLPWLFAGFLGNFMTPIVGFFVGKILDMVYEHVWRAISFAITDLQMDIQKKAYDAATEQLRGILEKENASKEDIERAKQEFKDKFHDIVKFPKSVAA